MTTQDLFRFTFRTSALAATLALATAGCKKAPIDDATLTTNIHTALTADAAIATEPIQPTVTNGVVTLNGNVSNDTARFVAAQDTAKVAGVKEVVNDLTIQGVQIAPTITTPDAPMDVRPATKQERQIIAHHQPLPPPPDPGTAPAPPPPPPAPPAQAAQSLPEAPAPPPPPPAPIVRNVNVPPGTGISVRVTQTLDSGTTEEGTTFTGVVTNSVVIDGEVAIPAGSGVTGRVLDVHEAGHYKGNSLLSVELTGIRRRGENIPVSTDPYTLEGKGRGKNTAEKVGGGAAVGAILGGILGGGKGAAIGAGVGAGAGGVANGVTRGQQVQISSESIVRFHVANGFSVRSAGPADDSGDDRGNGGLQPR
jgi:hypothetical protein